MGIATHIGRGCEAFNPARHIVVPWLLMIFGANGLGLGLGNFRWKGEYLKLVDGGSADGLVSVGLSIFFHLIPGCWSPDVGIQLITWFWTMKLKFNPGVMSTFGLLLKVVEEMTFVWSVPKKMKTKKIARWTILYRSYYQTSGSTRQKNTSNSKKNYIFHRFPPTKKHGAYSFPFPLGT